MGDRPSAATLRAWTGLVRAQAAVLGAVEHDLRQAGFPPLAWYDVLLELRRAAPAGLRPLALESRLLLAQHNVSRLLARLAEQGLVERRPAPEDGRGQLVTVTDAGRELLARMWPVYAAAIERHVGGRLDGADASRLADLLARLAGR